MSKLGKLSTFSFSLRLASHICHLSCGSVGMSPAAACLFFSPMLARSDYFLWYFALATISSYFSYYEKGGRFLRSLAMSGSSLNFNSISSYIMSFNSLFCFAYPRLSELRRRLRCEITISGLSTMKIFDQRYLIRGSEKKLKRTQLLFSLKV